MAAAATSRDGGFLGATQHHRRDMQHRLGAQLKELIPSRHRGRRAFSASSKCADRDAKAGEKTIATSAKGRHTSAAINYAGLTTKVSPAPKLSQRNSRTAAPPLMRNTRSAQNAAPAVSRGHGEISLLSA